jgi:hypothetical protein
VELNDGVVLIAGVGHQMSYPDSCQETATKLVVFRSEDQGKTWTMNNLATFATFPCCGHTRDISPILTSDSMNRADLLFFGNSTSKEPSCAILFVSSNDTGISWSRPVSLSDNAPQSFIDPSIATYTFDELQLFWIDIGGSLWRLSDDGGKTWTRSSSITEDVVPETDDVSKLHSHLALDVDSYNDAHIVFSISAERNDTAGTIYYVKQKSLRNWFLKPLELGLWIVTVSTSILIVAGWFIYAKWKQDPVEYDTV